MGRSFCSEKNARGYERCAAVLLAPHPLIAERVWQPALELPVEFPSYTVTESVVEAARKRIR